jgi:hypothetical protein
VAQQKIITTYTMTEIGKLILKLAVLVVPSIVVLYILYAGPKGDGVGGGGYDLSELVYSGSLTLFIFVWNIWVLVVLLNAKTPVSKLNNQILLAIGFLAFITSAFWFLNS